MRFVLSATSGTAQNPSDSATPVNACGCGAPQPIGGYDRVAMETAAEHQPVLGLNGHALLDARRLATHREIAKRIDADPSLLGKALGNIERWSRQMGRTPPALAEWQGLLRTLPWERIRPLLVQDDEESRRLRQSSPFVGILTQRERMEIRRATQ